MNSHSIKKKKLYLVVSVWYELALLSPPLRLTQPIAVAGMNQSKLTFNGWALWKKKERKGLAVAFLTQWLNRKDDETEKKGQGGSREARPGLAKRPACDSDRLECLEAVWIDSRLELSDFAITLMTET